MNVSFMDGHVKTVRPEALADPNQEAKFFDTEL